MHKLHMMYLYHVVKVKIMISTVLFLLLHAYEAQHNWYDIHAIIIQATCPRDCACVFHTALDLMLIITVPTYL